MQSPRHAGLPEKPTYTIEEMEKVREVHDESSAQMIEESITKPELSLGLENCREYTSYIAKVSKYHRKLDLQEMEDTSIGGKEVRLQLLAALLRLGDVLDADYRRVNMAYLSLREIPVESKYHWWCHHYVQSVLIQKGHIKIYFRFPEEYKNDEVTVVIKRRIEESISKTFFEVYDILDENEVRLYREIEVEEETYLSKGSLQVIPDDLYKFIDENVLNTVERSKQESERTGLVWHVDGVPFSDDTPVVKCMSRMFTLVKEERYLDAAREIEECRLLTMTPKDRMIFSNIAGSCYCVLGRLDDAEDYYNDVLRLSERRDLQGVYKEDVLQARTAAYGNLGAVYSNKGELDQALEFSKQALRSSEEIGYKQAEANNLATIGGIYKDRGNLKKALKYSLWALKIYREIGYKKGEFIQLGNIGLIHAAKGNMNEALNYFGQALKGNREMGYKREEADNLLNIGVIYINMKDFDEALNYSVEALKIHQKIGHFQGEIISFANIGFIYIKKGNLDEAIEYSTKALESAEKRGYKLGEISGSENLSLIYREKGDLNRAFEYSEKALVTARKKGYREKEAFELGNIGLIFRDKGDLDAALKYLKDALEILRQIGRRLEESRTCGHIGEIYRTKGYWNEAMEYLGKARAIAKDIGYKREEAHQLDSIGRVYNEKGDIDQALKCFESASEICREIGYKQGEASSLANIGLIYSDRGDLDQALKYLEDARNILDQFELTYGRDTIEKAIETIKKEKK